MAELANPLLKLSSQQLDPTKGMLAFVYNAICRHRPSMLFDAEFNQNKQEKIMFDALSGIMHRAWTQLPSARPHLAVLLGELLHLHDQFCKANDPFSLRMFAVCRM